MYKNLLVMASVAIVGVACEKDKASVNAPLTENMVTNLAADTTTGFSATGRPLGANTYTFFSLRDNKIITGADTLTNKWDIAFKQFYVKVNGGTSATGGGNAGAFVANSTFEAYSAIVQGDTAFKQDAAPAYAINPAPGAWYTYNTTSFVALPIPGKIIVVRTADGRFAKLEILSFYKDGITPDASVSLVDKAKRQFFYKFRFVFQANGSRAF